MLRLATGTIHASGTNVWTSWLRADGLLLFVILALSSPTVDERTTGLTQRTASFRGLGHNGGLHVARDDCVFSVRGPSVRSAFLRWPRNETDEPVNGELEKGH